MRCYYFYDKDNRCKNDCFEDSNSFCKLHCKTFECLFITKDGYKCCGETNDDIFCCYHENLLLSNYNRYIKKKKKKINYSRYKKHKNQNDIFMEWNLRIYFCFKLNIYPDKGHRNRILILFYKFNKHYYLK